MGFWRRVLIEGEDPEGQLADEAAEYLKTGKVPPVKETKRDKKKRKGEK